jgi:hypothetical protein
MDSLSDKVRALAKAKFVLPEKRAGKIELSIAVKDLLKHLDKTEFPGNRVPLVCNAIKTRGFQRENGLEVIAIDGPKSKMSPTVVVHYRVLGSHSSDHREATPSSNTEPIHEQSGDRAERLIAKLRASVKLDLTEYGGVEGFMRWVRGHDEEGE